MSFGSCQDGKTLKIRHSLKRTSWKNSEFVALVELLFPTLKNSRGIGVWFTVQQIVATPRSANPMNTLDISDTHTDWPTSFYNLLSRHRLRTPRLSSWTDL